MRWDEQYLYYFSEFAEVDGERFEGYYTVDMATGTRSRFAGGEDAAE